MYARMYKIYGSRKIKLGVSWIFFIVKQQKDTILIRSKKVVFGNEEWLH